MEQAARWIQRAVDRLRDGERELCGQCNGLGEHLHLGIGHVGDSIVGQALRFDFPLVDLGREHCPDTRPWFRSNGTDAG